MATLTWNPDASRYEVISSYAERAIPKQAGFRWDPACKRWWTDQEHKAAKLATIATGMAKSRLAEHVERAERSIAESHATDADIHIPAPAGLDYMPFQRAGIRFASQRSGTLIGDEMGLGKTIQALGLINLDESIRRVLVLCPASLKLNWRREATKWLTRFQQVAVSSSTEAFPAGADVVIINYDILGKFDSEINASEWDLVIMDECHYIKNPKAQRAQRAMKIPARRRLMLTGTPIVNRPKELWNLLKLLDPARWTHFMAFATRYCDAKHNGWGWDFNGASNLEELHNVLRSTVMVRRLKSEVLKDLPPKRRSVVEIPTNGSTGLVARENMAYDEYQRVCAELRMRMLEAEIADDREGFTRLVSRLKAEVEAAFEDLSALRKATAVAKVKLLKEHLQDLLDAGQKVVVFAHHHDVIDNMMELFGDAAVKLDGRMTAEQKDESVRRFQEDPAVKVFVGSIVAAGVGITLTASSQVVFVELDWVPGNMQQAEDRCHRIGQVDSVNVQYLVLENSIDAKMAHTLVEKMEVIEAALDRTPGESVTEQFADLGGLDIARIEQEAEAAQRKWEERQVALKKQAEELGLDQGRIDAIHEALRFLAARCDGAVQQDGTGFNRNDSNFGKDLAWRGSLTPKQAAVGFTLVRKYRGQLPHDMLAAAGLN